MRLLLTYIKELKYSLKPYETAVKFPILQMRKMHLKKVEDNLNVGFNGFKASLCLQCPTTEDSLCYISNNVSCGF